MHIKINWTHTFVDLCGTRRYNFVYDYLSSTFRNCTDTPANTFGVQGKVQERTLVFGSTLRHGNVHKFFEFAYNTIPPNGRVWSIPFLHSNSNYSDFIETTINITNNHTYYVSFLDIHTHNATKPSKYLGENAPSTIYWLHFDRNKFTKFPQQQQTNVDIMFQASKSIVQRG